MVITAERLSETIAQVYAAVGTPDGFTHLLRGVRNLLDASSAMLFTPLRDPSVGGFGFVDHVNLEFDNDYRTYYKDKEPWAREGERKGVIKTGYTFTDESLLPQSALRKEEFYLEVMVPLNATRLCCSTVAADDDSLSRIYLSFFRGPAERAFEEEQRRVLELLSPHVLQALRLASRLNFAESALASAYSALHEVACGVVVLDRQKRIVFMNRGAEQLCDGERGLLIAKRLQKEPVLRATRMQEDTAVQQAIDAALRVGELNTCHPPQSRLVAVHGAAGLDPLLVTALPLPLNMLRIGSHQGQVVVLIEDPGQKRRCGERLLTGLFGFTPAECRVAEALLAGGHPKSIAHRLAVSENTVRTQIKSLYDKAGTQGMTALIALLSRLAATQASGANS